MGLPETVSHTPLEEESQSGAGAGGESLAQPELVPLPPIAGQGVGAEGAETGPMTNEHGPASVAQVRESKGIDRGGTGSHFG